MEAVGKWAWYIGLALLVLGGILGAFMDNPLSGLADIALAAAFVGGLLHLASGDRTALYIAAGAFALFSAGGLFVDILGDLVAGILAGGGAAAGAGAAGVLVIQVWDWVSEIWS